MPHILIGNVTKRKKSKKSSATLRFGDQGQNKMALSLVGLYEIGRFYHFILPHILIRNITKRKNSKKASATLRFCNQGKNKMADISLVGLYENGIFYVYITESQGCRSLFGLFLSGKFSINIYTKIKL